jgi:hypothetical protein
MIKQIGMIFTEGDMKYKVTMTPKRHSKNYLGAIEINHWEKRNGVEYKTWTELGTMDFPDADIFQAKEQLMKVVRVA